MNPGGAFLIFIGALVLCQVTVGQAVERLNLWGTSTYNPGNSLGDINPDGSGTGGLLTPPGTGLQPGTNPAPIVAPVPGRPIRGDVPGVTGAQPNGLGGFLDGLTH